MCRIQLFCCCGCKLESAAIVASVITGIVTAAYIIIASNLWVTANKIKGYDGADSLYNAYVGGGVAAFIFGMVALGILLCLICAIKKKNPAFLLPWLIGDMINIVLEFIGLLIIFIMACVGAPVLLLAFCVQAAWVSFELYTWIAVLSYYKIMKEEQKNLVPPYQDVQQNVPPNYAA